MKTHHLKIWPEHFAAVRAKLKLAELRYNDRGYCLGDLLQLQEFDPQIGAYTGEEITKRVIHIAKVSDFLGDWDGAGYVLLSLAD